MASILQNNSGLTNPSNSHFQDFTNTVLPSSGCGGASTSAQALNGEGLFKYVAKGGRKHRTKKNKRKGMKGGKGYGFSTNQHLSSHSGVSSGHRAHFNTYENAGIQSDTNLNASAQHGGSFGTGAVPYYGFEGGENLSEFAGAGYAPIKVSMNNQCGGKKYRKQRKSRKQSKSRKQLKPRKTRKSKKQRKSRKQRRSRQRGGTSNVAFSQGYSVGGELSASNSGLATPAPHTAYNNCQNTWQHLGDSAPFNKVM